MSGKDYKGIRGTKSEYVISASTEQTISLEALYDTISTEACGLNKQMITICTAFLCGMLVFFEKLFVSDAGGSIIFLFGGWVALTGKAEFPFAAAAQIPKLMQELEQSALKKHTPCKFKTLERVAEAIATVHVELVIIHPFREGNGRAARLLADLMAMQANYPPLDYTSISRGKQRESYFRAVQQGMNKNYQPMVEIFGGVISRTLKETQK